MEERPRNPSFTNILLSSSDRLDSSDPPTNCIVRMQPPLNLSQTKSINLINFNLVPGVGNINSLYNTFYVDDSVQGVKAIVLDEGFYNVVVNSIGYISFRIFQKLQAAFGLLQYDVTFSVVTQKITITNIAGNTFRLLWDTAPVTDKSILISQALGYGIPFGLADTAFATSHTGPGPVILTYPPTYRIIIEPLPTACVRTTDGQPATFLLSTGTTQRAITFFNNSQTASLIKTGDLCGIGSISEFRVRIEPATRSPPYPLTQNLNNWTMILTVREE